MEPSSDRPEEARCGYCIADVHLLHYAKLLGTLIGGD
jgi:hypothetical protein